MLLEVSFLHTHVQKFVTGRSFSGLNLLGFIYLAGSLCRCPFSGRPYFHLICSPAPAQVSRGCTKFLGSITVVIMTDADLATAQRARLEKLGDAVPTPGMIPSWHHNDVFGINSTQECNLKIALARECGIQYDAVGLDKPIALSVADVQPYEPDNIKDCHKKYLDIGKNVKTKTGLEDAAKTRPPGTRGSWHSATAS